MEDINKTPESEEYITFTTKAKDGSEVEMAVVDEFEFEHKNYVAGAKIDGDTISQDGVYIYRVKVKEEDFTVEKITNSVEYQKIANAYMEMEA